MWQIKAIIVLFWTDGEQERTCLEICESNFSLNLNIALKSLVPRRPCIRYCNSNVKSLVPRRPCIGYCNSNVTKSDKEITTNGAVIFFSKTLNSIIKKVN